jgi:hypothetical protein
MNRQLFLRRLLITTIALSAQVSWSQAKLGESLWERIAARPNCFELKAYAYFYFNQNRPVKAWNQELAWSALMLNLTEGSRALLKNASIDNADLSGKLLEFVEVKLINDRNRLEGEVMSKLVQVAGSATPPSKDEMIATMSALSGCAVAQQESDLAQVVSSNALTPGCSRLLAVVVFPQTFATEPKNRRAYIDDISQVILLANHLKFSLEPTFRCLMMPANYSEREARVILLKNNEDLRNLSLKTDPTTVHKYFLADRKKSSTERREALLSNLYKQWLKE